MIYSKDILAVFLSYAIGCISIGYYLTLFIAGRDIRTCGSGSTGAKNVGRILGKAGFIAAFLLDIARGVLAAWAATVLDIHSWAVMASLLAMLIGHIWPAQLGFRGGRGISVVIGFLLFFDYRIVALAVMIFCICLIISRKYEISMFVSLIAAPLMAFFTKHSILDICGITVIIIIVIFAHRQHILKFLRQPSIGIL
jgi:glycerol-3-phosphate acyltransferase PlsY